MSRHTNQFFILLKQEHQEVRSLIDRAEQASVPDRISILEKIRNKLIPHARAEEKTLYASLLEAGAGTDLERVVKEAYAQHHTADTFLSELNHLEAGNEKWKAKMSALKENLEHHIREEEELLFPKAEKFISQDLAEQLVEAFKVEKRRFLGSKPTQLQINARQKSSKLDDMTL